MDANTTTMLADTPAAPPTRECPQAGGQIGIIVSEKTKFKVKNVKHEAPLQTNSHDSISTTKRCIKCGVRGKIIKLK